MEKKKKGPTDDQLIYEIQHGDSDIALRELIDKYKKYCPKIARDMLNNREDCGILLDDLVDEAMEAIMTAATKYDLEKNHGTFYPYWRKTAQNAMNKYIKAHSYYKEVGFKVAFSLDEAIRNYPNMTMSDVIGEEDQEIKGFEYRDKLNMLREGGLMLSPIQNAVLQLMIDGDGLTEISNKLEIPISRVRSIQRSIEKKFHL